MCHFVLLRSSLNLFFLSLGILFATNPLENPNDPTGPPPNLAFLEIAAEFTNKLLKQDKKMVLLFLVSFHV